MAGGSVAPTPRLATGPPQTLLIWSLDSRLTARDAAAGRPHRLAVLQKKLVLFVSWYNGHRPHSRFAAAAPDEIY
jgi:hypothetical protein